MGFHDRGYVVVRELLKPAAVEACIRRLEQLSGRTRESFDSFRVRGVRRGVYRAWTLPDGVSKVRDFWPILLDPRLTGAVRDLLGPDIRYLQHSDLHVGFSAVTWHRDNVNRRFGVGPDWDESVEPYRLARVGVYLQSFERSRFALRVVPASHRVPGPGYHRRMRDVERRAGAFSQAMALVTGRDPMGHHAAVIETEPGDAIVFDPRLLHAGSYIQGPKYSLFMAYGAPGRHFERHAAYYRHVRRELRYADLDPELVERLQARGLYAPPAERAALEQAYRPSGLERLLGRGVRPEARY
jgi:hypothetical protein